MDLDQAAQKHAEWKTKFRAAISKHERMDAAAIQQDNQCELGKWLHGEAKKKHATLAAYQECVTKHAAFHKEAGKVATAINAEKYTEAEAMLGGTTSYGSASTAVIMALATLKKSVG
jgi:Chemoreceptor zinc-binding domain